LLQGDSGGSRYIRNLPHGSGLRRADGMQKTGGEKFIPAGFVVGKGTKNGLILQPNNIIIAQWISCVNMLKVFSPFCTKREMKLCVNLRLVFGEVLVYNIPRKQEG